MSTTQDAKDDKIDRLLATLWQKNLPTLRVRLDVLDQVAAQMANLSLSEEDRVKAESIAHKLSGSLGMFGYDEGTKIARQIEELLRKATTVVSPAQQDVMRLGSLVSQLRISLALGL